MLKEKELGPDKLSIFHLKHLGHNLAYSGYMKVIIHHHYTKSWQGHRPRNSYRPIWLLYPTAKVLDSTYYQQLSPSCSRPEHSTTSALLQLTPDIKVAFNQRRFPDRTVCVTVDLSDAFDTVCHSNLLSKLNISHLPPATAHDDSPYIKEGDHSRLASEM